MMMQDEYGNWYDDGFQDGGQEFNDWLMSGGGGVDGGGGMPTGLEGGGIWDPSMGPIPGGTGIDTSASDFWGSLGMSDPTGPGNVGGWQVNDLDNPNTWQWNGDPTQGEPWYKSLLKNLGLGSDPSSGGSKGSSGLSNAGQIAGSAAQAAAQGRLAEALYLTGRDRNALDFWKTAQEAPSLLGRQAVKGSLMANGQDTTVSHPRAEVVHFGGPKPSLLTPEARQLGGDLARKALAQEQLLPSSPMPTLSPMPQAGFLEKANTGIANGAGLLDTVGSIWDLFRKQQQEG